MRIHGESFRSFWLRFDQKTVWMVYHFNPTAKQSTSACCHHLFHNLLVGEKRSFRWFLF